MKISPENFIVDEGLCLKYKSFFVSGNDEGYIFSFVEHLVKCFSKKGFVKKIIINETDTSSDLFKTESKYIYVCEKYIDDATVCDAENNNDIFVFYEKTSPKNKVVKRFFSSSKERALVECYELDRAKKKIILDGFIEKNNLALEKNIYWYLLDFLENRFSI